MSEQVCGKVAKLPPVHSVTPSDLNYENGMRKLRTKPCLSKLPQLYEYPQEMLEITVYDCQGVLVSQRKGVKLRAQQGEESSANIKDYKRRKQIEFHHETEVESRAMRKIPSKIEHDEPSGASCLDESQGSEKQETDEEARIQPEAENSTVQTMSPCNTENATNANSASMTKNLKDCSNEMQNSFNFILALSDLRRSSSTLIQLVEKVTFHLSTENKYHEDLKLQDSLAWLLKESIYVNQKLELFSNKFDIFKSQLIKRKLSEQHIVRTALRKHSYSTQRANEAINHFSRIKGSVVQKLSHILQDFQEINKASQTLLEAADSQSLNTDGSEVDSSYIQPP